MIAIGCDHAGYSLKKQIMQVLSAEGVLFSDFGTFNEQSCDYPLFAAEVCKSVQNRQCDKGILVCGTGIGMSIAANKFDGIRCALCSDEFSAQATRAHNNSNVLAIGARVLDEQKALSIVRIWLNTEYEGGRHDKRLELIKDIETSQKQK